MGRGGGSRAAGAIAHMEMGEVFKTAGFRRARGRARGSCGPLQFRESLCGLEPDRSTSVTPVCPRRSLGDFDLCQLYAPMLVKGRDVAMLDAHIVDEKTRFDHARISPRTYPDGRFLPQE